MADPRRIVLADPLARPGARRSRFAVAGQGGAGASGDVKMFEWDGEAENMSMIGLQSDIGAGIKALAWSPHPAQRHLLALGLSTGRMHILSLSPSSLTLPLRGASGNTATQSTLLTVKHSRAVTSLSFSQHDPMLLAAGYERHRSDYSLLIWDVTDAVSHLASDPEGDPTWIRPTERLEYSSMNLGPLRGAASERDQQRHVQQYCASETVHSVAWVPGSAHELLASANNKAVRMYDLRAPARDTGGLSGGAAIHWPTRAVHYLTPDPERKHRVASVESSQNGSVVRMWDTRRPGHEFAAFEVTDTSGVVTLEWQRGGTHDHASLGVGTREGGVSLWDIVSGRERADGTDEWTTISGMRHVVKPRQQLQSFTFAPPTPTGKRDVVFVVKDGQIGVGPLPGAPALAFSARGDLTLALSGLTTVDPEQPSQTQTPSPPQPQAITPRPEYERADSQLDERRHNRFQLAPERVSQLLTQQRDSRSGSASPNPLRGHESRQSLPALIDQPEEDHDWEFAEEIANADGVRRVLRNDAAFIMRRRVEEGYGLDNLELNAAVATRFPGAQRVVGTWEFVDHFLHATGPEMSRTGEYDLTYQGLWAIWSGLLGSEAQVDAPPASAAWSNLRSQIHSRDGSGSGASTPRRGPTKEYDAAYTAAVQRLNTARLSAGHVAAPGKHKLPHTDRPAQRRMMLAVCGENHAYDTMAEVNRLVADHQRTKAACWAFFAGEEQPAITILMRSDDEKHRLMGATIAGFMTQSRAERGSLFWQEHWRGMVDKIDDPYIRAVLARIAGENWDGILYDEILPLLDRVAVAVCNLSDKDLTSFLRNRLNRCINLGALPGLALTGFNSAGVTLLQRFVDRTGDVQTAALLSAFFPHAQLARSDLASVHRWQETYRTYLDSWLSWLPRCAFDVAVIAERRRLGDDARDAVHTVVVCPVCSRQLTKQSFEMLGRKNAIRGKMGPPTVRSNVCTYCQNALARCCICLLHVRPNDIESADAMEDAYVACQTCRHGGHASHILAWFEGGLDGEPPHDVCPVAGCDCQCANL